MMPAVIYSLCALTAFVCAVLLWQGYMREHYRLLLWGSLCFFGLTLNNIFLVADKYIILSIDLLTLRLVTGLLAMTILLYGLIWDSE
jgi:hypothetical protein